MENLSDDDLLEIFKYLNSYDLDHASQVCKHWNSAISSSAKQAGKLCLVVDCDVKKRFAQVQKRSKMFAFRNVVIKNIQSAVDSEMLQKLFKDYKNHQERLRLLRCNNLLSLNFLSKTNLNLSLTHLCIHGGKGTKGRNETSDEKLKFPSLKYFKCASTSTFFNHIKDHKIETLEITGQNPKKNWREFLKTCLNLKNLVLKKFFHFDASDLGLKLEQFVLQGYEEESGIREFLMSQKKTLKILKLQSFQSEDKELFLFVINELDVETFHHRGEIHRTNKEIKLNTSIKVLSFEQMFFPIMYRREDFEYDRKLFENLKNVENLQIHARLGFNVTLMEVMKNSMKKLKNLMIQMRGFEYYTYPNCQISDIKFERVENFEFIGKPLNEFFPLLSCCPNTKRLKISGKLDDEQFEVLIKSLDKLEEIYITDFNSFTEKAVEILLNSKIYKICVEKDSHTLDNHCELIKRLKQCKIFVEIIKSTWERSCSSKPKYENFEDDDNYCGDIKL